MSNGLSVQKLDRVKGSCVSNGLSVQKLRRAKVVVLGVISNVDYTECGIIPHC